MTAPARKTPAEIKFRVDPAEKAQADRIAASVGMDTNAAMKVMFKRFLAARGFPFEMAAAGNAQGAETPFGVSLARLAQVSAAGFEAAAHGHERAGRRPAPAVAARRRATRRR